MIAGRLHSRERVTWTHLYAGLSLLLLGRLREGEEELETGLAMAEGIGERRVAMLLLAYLANAQGMLGDLDKAHATAGTAVARAEDSKLIYMRTESKRVMGEILVLQGRLEDGIRQFEEILEITAGTDARVSRLWAGPPHVDALLAAGRRDEARTRFDGYAAMVSQCQSPRFSRELDRLRGLF